MYFQISIEYINIENQFCPNPKGSLIFNSFSLKLGNEKAIKFRIKNLIPWTISDLVAANYSIIQIMSPINDSQKIELSYL